MYFSSQYLHKETLGDSKTTERSTYVCKRVILSRRGMGIEADLYPIFCYIIIFSVWGVTDIHYLLIKSN